MRELILKCRHFKQILSYVYILATLIMGSHAMAQVGREPANFVPDDDLIVVPMVIEKSFIEKFHDKHENEFGAARKKLRFWLSQEQYAKDYGLEDSGFIPLPTEQEKQKFLERNYLRFLSKDIEKSSNGALQETVEEWTTDDEIDSIKMVEMHEKTLVKAKQNRGQKVLKHTQTVKVAGESIKFGFQPRVEMGMVKMTLKSKHFYARAWVGINGNQELMVEKKIKATNTTAFVNYFIDQSRVIAAVDQTITNHLKLRLTHSKTTEGFSEMNEANETENNIIQLRFSLGF